jgi:hypothetical protein
MSVDLRLLRTVLGGFCVFFSQGVNCSVSVCLVIIDGMVPTGQLIPVVTIRRIRAIRSPILCACAACRVPLRSVSRCTRLGGSRSTLHGAFRDFLFGNSSHSSYAALTLVTEANLFRCIYGDNARKRSVSRHSYEWLRYGGHYDMVVSTRFFTIILHTTKSCNIFMSYTVYNTWSLLKNEASYLDYML